MHVKHQTRYSLSLKNKMTFSQVSGYIVLALDGSLEDLFAASDSTLLTIFLELTNVTKI